MKSIGYIRCSTEDQRTNGLSVEVQTARLTAWALVHGAELTIECDAGISGKSMANRPGLKRALDACRSGVVLVTCALDRLSRRTIDALQIAELLAKRGAELVSLKEQIPAGPAGKLILAVLASLAEIERDQVSTRTKQAMAYMAERGRYLGGRAPYGQALASDGLTLECVEAEQVVIARAMSLKASGLTLRGISATLAAEGKLGRSGKPFAPSAVAAMVA